MRSISLNVPCSLRDIPTIALLATGVRSYSPLLSMFPHGHRLNLSLTHIQHKYIIHASPSERERVCDECADTSYQQWVWARARDESSIYTPVAYTWYSDFLSTLYIYLSYLRLLSRFDSRMSIYIPLSLSIIKWACTYYFFTRDT